MASGARSELKRLKLLHGRELRLKGEKASGARWGLKHLAAAHIGEVTARSKRPAWDWNFSPVLCSCAGLRAEKVSAARSGLKLIWNKFPNYTIRAKGQRCPVGIETSKLLLVLHACQWQKSQGGPVGIETPRRTAAGASSPGGKKARASQGQGLPVWD